MHHGGDNHPQCIMAETIAHNASRLVYHCNRSPSERIHQVSQFQFHGGWCGCYTGWRLRFPELSPNFLQDRTGQDRVRCHQTDVNRPAVERNNGTIQWRLQSRNADMVTLQITRVWHWNSTPTRGLHHQWPPDSRSYCMHWLGALPLESSFFSQTNIT